MPRSLGAQRRAAKQGELAYRRTFERDFAPNPYHEPPSPGRHPGARVGRLIVHEIKQGKGPAIHGDANVWMDYIEANYTSGYEFMRVWGPHRAASMSLSSMMRGMLLGMQGMRPGGRRTILVPPQLSDVEPGDADRRGKSYREVVYFDVVLRSVLRPEQ
jgi:FKBP-type peptidyl-prolyl cis-trans isomerase